MLVGYCLLDYVADVGCVPGNHGTGRFIAHSFRSSLNGVVQADFVHSDVRHFHTVVLVDGFHAAVERFRLDASRGQ